jgi:hypothetical protein
LRSEEDREAGYAKNSDKQAGSALGISGCNGTNGLNSASFIFPDMLSLGHPQNCSFEVSPCAFRFLELEALEVLSFNPAAGPPKRKRLSRFLNSSTAQGDR